MVAPSTRNPSLSTLQGTVEPCVATISSSLANADERMKASESSAERVCGTKALATSLSPGLLSLRFEAVLKDGRQFVTEDVTTVKSSEVTVHVFLVP